jgi:hypothetical protein
MSVAEKNRTALVALPGRLGRATSLAATLEFDGPHPRHFGAPPATARPFVAGDFNGDVSQGASCNCRVVTLVPHCNGTHTETVAHLTREALRPGDVVPLHPLPALLIDVVPREAALAGETAEPMPRTGDRLLTAAEISAAWDAVCPTFAPGFAPRVLVIRSGPGSAVEPAPYLSLEAAGLLVARGIEHVVLELPSMDRAEDEGRLGAHRIFFGLPPGSTRLSDARRAHCTITELASVPPGLVAGACAVQLQLTAWSGDAVPSRPVHFELDPS